MSWFIHVVMAAESLCNGSASNCGLPSTPLNNATLGTVITTVYQVVGGLSVLFLVLGGARYAVSGGDPSNTKKAKETILYSIIGMVIALMAFLAVQFITNKAGNGFQ